jgi:NitT/TauT family transport system ATP-binding protein
MMDGRPDKVAIENLRMEFKTLSGEKVLALDGINLNVRANEFLTVVGSSGCGKSTLLYLIGGFLKPSQGEVRIEGKVISGPDPSVGIVFQRYSLFPWLSVLKNITFGLEEKKMGKKERTDIAKHYLKLVQLEGFENKYPRELSGGMQQRVAIAQTLACDPEVILMDEPFGALDAQTRKLMQSELLKIWGGEKKTIIFVTHDVEEAIFLGTRVVVMTARPGKIKSIEDSFDMTKESEEEYLSNPNFLKLRNKIWISVKEEVTKGNIQGDHNKETGGRGDGG